MNTAILKLIFHGLICFYHKLRSGITGDPQGVRKPTFRLTDLQVNALLHADVKKNTVIF